MTIEDYVKKYTAGYRIYFFDFLKEIKEFIVELIKFNNSGMSDEFQDIFHFLQLWLYWRFGINGEIWKITQKSVNKFIERHKIWQEIYELVGLDRDISGYAGNYEKIDKVIKQLAKFGVNKEKAEEAYRVIVLKE